MKNLIVFRNNPIAIIHPVKSGFDVKTELVRLEIQYPKKCFRVYFWIDNIPDSLTKNVKDEFLSIFNQNPLSEKLHNDGKPFLISAAKQKDSDRKDVIAFTPREGQDGGVIGRAYN